MNEEFYKGAKVRHKSQPAWGIGTIKEIRGDGRFAVINFAYVGQKKILLDESYLEVVQGVVESPVERPPVRVLQPPPPPPPPKSPDEQMQALFEQIFDRPINRGQVRPALSILAQLYKNRQVDEEQHNRGLLERWNPYAEKGSNDPPVDATDWDERTRKLVAHMIRQVGWDAVADPWEYASKTLDLIRLFALSDQQGDGYVEATLRAGGYSSLTPRAVVVALANLGSPKALFFLHRVFQNHEDAAVRAEARAAIKYLSSRSAEDLFIQALLSGAVETPEIMLDEASRLLIVLLSYDLPEQHRVIKQLKERQPELLAALAQESARELYRVVGEAATRVDEHVTVLSESLLDFVLISGVDAQSTAYRQAVEYLKRIKDPDREAMIVSYLPESTALEYFQYIFSPTRLVTRERRSSGLMLLLDHFADLRPKLHAQLTRWASEERSPELRQRLADVLSTTNG